MTSYIPKPGDWKILGDINGHLTYLAKKPEAKVIGFESKNSMVSYVFEKGTRIYMQSGDSGIELHFNPDNSLLKRVAIA